MTQKKNRVLTWLSVIIIFGMLSWLSDQFDICVFQLLKVAGVLGFLLEVKELKLGTITMLLVTWLGGWGLEETFITGGEPLGSSGSESSSSASSASSSSTSGLPGSSEAPLPSLSLAGEVVGMEDDPVTPDARIGGLVTEDDDVPTPLRGNLVRTHRPLRGNHLPTNDSPGNICFGPNRATSRAQPVVARRPNEPVVGQRRSVEESSVFERVTRSKK